MDIPLAVSIAALLVSLSSASFSIYFNAREKARLKSFSRLYKGDERDPPSLSITAINVGRRPLILRMWVGTDDRKEWAGTFLGKDKQGVRLDEHERLDVTLDNLDLGLFHEDTAIEFTELWFEDSRGQRCRVKDSRKHIKEFWSYWKAHAELVEARREIHNLVVHEIRVALKNEDGVDP